jgi:hypothetical protein
MWQLIEQRAYAHAQDLGDAVQRVYRSLFFGQDRLVIYLATNLVQKLLFYLIGRQNRLP